MRPIARSVEFKPWDLDNDQVRITFKGDLAYAALENGCYQLARPITCVLDGIDWFTIPAGFVTDFLSTPRWLWWWVDRFDPKWIFGACAHDYLYDQRCPVNCSRLDADCMLRDSGATTGASHINRILIYAGVRTFGGKYWRAQTGLPRGSA